MSRGSWRPSSLFCAQIKIFSRKDATVRMNRLAVDALAFQNDAFAFKKKKDQSRVGVKARESLVSFCGFFLPPHLEAAVDVTERPADCVHVQRLLQQ